MPEFYSPMTDDFIIEEAIRLVGEGVSVTFPVKGRSMLPFIIGGRESVILSKPVELRRGDVVLAWVEGGRYVVHRIIKIDAERITLMGDGNVRGTERCTKADVKAIATHVVSERGRKRDLYNAWRRAGARVWYWLRPFRRYLLYIYRLLCLRN